MGLWASAISMPVARLYRKHASPLQSPSRVCGNSTSTHHGQPSPRAPETYFAKQHLVRFHARGDATLPVARVHHLRRPTSARPQRTTRFPSDGARGGWLTARFALDYQLAACPAEGHTARDNASCEPGCAHAFARRTALSRRASRARITTSSCTALAEPAAPRAQDAVPPHSARRAYGDLLQQPSAVLAPRFAFISRRALHRRLRHPPETGVRGRLSRRRLSQPFKRLLVRLPDGTAGDLPLPAEYTPAWGVPGSRGGAGCAAPVDGWVAIAAFGGRDAVLMKRETPVLYITLGVTV
ncbi:hypothetical protein CALVIDRAFT_221468 [Calocera viscosa TUFC12733]|uniref:Uncharacterized protein n=1 Tax=Calocera viscosa (strain TUFC12733) TaxID=1330018 RepID=A0A167K5U7_CALVF|nr:hypothetical protein CALVIDRAFT_221468 [Calocera viscosa TUFC12733]